jgi:hypothetical protein
MNFVTVFVFLPTLFPIYLWVAISTTMSYSEPPVLTLLLQQSF